MNFRNQSPSKITDFRIIKKSPILGISEAPFFWDIDPRLVIIQNQSFLESKSELSSYTLKFDPGRLFFKDVILEKYQK